MSMPKDYKLLTIEIDDQEVQSYYSDTTELTLVGLKDEDGKVELYIYIPRLLYACHKHNNNIICVL